MIGGKKEVEQALSKKEKVIAMLAPSFVADFNYPNVVNELRNLGFDKIVELTFGAKLVNRDYHKLLAEHSDKLWISSVCPGVVQMIRAKFPNYVKNLMPFVSPMTATAMICKKVYPKHKTCFISPCPQKKVEASWHDCVDFAIGYPELKEMIKNCKVKTHKSKTPSFDLFYNEFTRIYPISGGLSKSAHIQGVLKVDSAKVIDGWNEIEKFLKKTTKGISFLDCTFCEGGCIGGPYTDNRISLQQKKKRVLAYLELAKKLKIPASKKGILKKAEGLDFGWRY